MDSCINCCHGSWLTWGGHMPWSCLCALCDITEICCPCVVVHCGSILCDSSYSSRSYTAKDCTLLMSNNALLNVMLCTRLLFIQEHFAEKAGDRFFFACSSLRSCDMGLEGLAATKQITGHDEGKIPKPTRVDPWKWSVHDREEVGLFHPFGGTYNLHVWGVRTSIYEVSWTSQKWTNYEKNCPLNYLEGPPLGY